MSVKIQLENGFLDVKEGTAFPLNFGVADIRDISKRSGAFSKTITLSGTKNNHDLLNHYYDINIQEGTFNINTLTRCAVIQNGIPVLESGYIQLISINKIQNTSSLDDGVEYEVLVKDESADFFTKLDNKELTDLDLSDLNHTITASDIVASYSNTVADGYKYILPYSGDNQYNIGEMRPAVYAKVYFDRIFSNAGFSYTWSTLTDAHFDKLLIPFTGEAPTLDLEDYKVEATKVITINNTQGAGPHADYTEQLDNFTEVTDVNNLFDPTLGEYDTPFYVNSGESIDVTITFTAEISLINGTGSTAYLVDMTSGGAKYYRYRPLFKIGLNGSPLWTSGDSLPFVQRGEGALNTGTTSLGTITNSVTLSCSPLVLTDLLTIYGGVKSSAVFTTNSNLRWKSTNSTAGTDVTVDVQIDYTSIDVQITPSASVIASGATLEVNRFIPNKIKQKDFIKSIFTMYNLYVEQDPDTPNKLILQHRDDYYDSGAEKDWSLKLAKDREQIVQFLPELSAKKLILTYKQDDDDPNKNYFNATREVYGQVEYTFDNEYVKGSDVNEIIFSPTPIAQVPCGAYVPMLGGNSPQVNIRILQDGGVGTCGGYDIYDYGSTGQIGVTTYPIIHHWDDPLNPTFDINFSVCDYYYYSGYSLTNNNLYNLYWRRTINQINSGKMLIAYFYLTEADIQSMKLNDKIWIDNSWWTINRVIDYDCNTSNLTKVELMSADTEIDLAPFKTREAIDLGGANLPKYTNSVLVSNAQNNNTIGPLSQTTVHGKGNTIQSGVKAVVIGDNQVVNDDGLWTQKINGSTIDEFFDTNAANFANTDLTFTGNRTHDTDGYGLAISVDIAGNSEGELSLSNTNAYVLFGNKGFYADADSADIKGSLKVSVATTNIAYTLGADNNVLLCNGTFTVNLPAVASSSRRVYTIKNIGSGTVTLDGNGSETIDGATTQTLAQYDSLTVVCDGSNWYII